jgi:hypothetical protein
MRISRCWMGIALIVLLAAFAARAERLLMPSGLMEGWRENRNALLKAVDAAWVPSSGASLIDWAMRSCDPAWETSEERTRLAVRMAARSSKHFTDVSFFRDLLHQIGRPNEGEAEK